MAAPVCCSCEAAPATVRLDRWDLCPSCALDYLDPGPSDDGDDSDWLGVQGGRGMDRDRDDCEEESLDAVR